MLLRMVLGVLFLVNFTRRQINNLKRKTSPFERGFRRRGRRARTYINPFFSIALIFLLFETEVRALILYI